VAFHANRALRLSPFDSRAFEAHLALGTAAISEGNTDYAVSCFARGSEINPNHSIMPFFHAIALALAGRAEDATLNSLTYFIASSSDSSTAICIPLGAQHER
jgi:hypothetical protein